MYKPVILTQLIARWCIIFAEQSSDFMEQT
jgi:hypothetical protein